jgi:uncharacterized membrane protein YfcA
MFNLNSLAILTVSISSLLIGISKTGIPGVGSLVVPLMASVLPARASVGIVLPMLMFADIFAALYYRHSAQWWHLFRLTPWALVGILIGYFSLSKVNDQQLKPIIGGIVFFMLAVDYWREQSKGGDAQIPTYWWFVAVLGLFTGITSMMANAAGPIMIIYLLAMRLPKIEFIGTSAWYFFIINWIKVPFMVNLGLIHVESLKFDLALFPLIAIGALAGIVILKRIPQKAFRLTVQILAAAASLHLLFSPIINLLMAS